MQGHLRELGRRFALWPVLCLVTGCAHYEAVPLYPKASADGFGARRLTDARLREQVAILLPEAAAEWPPQQWNRAQLLAVALTQNPQLAVAHAEVGAALSHEISAAEAPNPDLTLQSEYARHDPHPWLYGISLNWLLRSGGRRDLETELARLDTRKARWQLMDRAWGVRRDLAAALSDWESARRRSRLVDRLASALDRLRGVEQQRVSLGEDAPIELINAEQSRIQIEQQQVELRQTAEAAQAATAKALGVPVQALDGVAFVWADWGSPPPVDADTQRQAQEQALLSRADLNQAIGEYAQAEAKLKLSIARQYPEVVLEPGYYWDHGIAKFPFDVGFTLPLNRNRGEIAEARAGRELAAQRMLAIQAEAYADIAAAQRAELVARAGAAAAERQLAAARRQKDETDLSFRLGATTSEEQIGSEILIARAELELVQVRTELQNSRNALEDALHAPLSGPELAMAGAGS